MAAISYPTPEPLRRGSRPAPRQRHLRLIQGGLATTPARPAPGVYSRRRLVALVVAAAVIMGAVLAVQAIGSMLVVRGAPAPAAAASAPGTGGEVHVVQPGETLWAIASERSGGGDVRATLDRLIERNGGITTVQAGQRLVLD